MSKKQGNKVKHILTRIKELEQQSGVKRTLLAVCPNSMAVIKAAIRAAKRNNAPIKFAATLNQIDLDRGYTGMTQYEFVKIINQEVKRYNYTGKVIIAVDHGGPWLKDIDRINNLNFEQTFENVKKSLIAAVDAGYDMLHVDPTVDITLSEGQIISIETVAHRTVELISHVEKYRRQNNLPPIDYEVGTEEVHGGLADLEVFRNFFELLKSGLAERGLTDVWPIFVVAKVGTDLHTTEFDPQVAKEVVKIAAQYGSFIKGHYTDNVINPEAYPQTGMGGANVGPEFTENEYDALIELEKIEIKHKEQIPVLSEIKDTIWKAVIESNRWKKWLLPHELGKDFYELERERQLWLIKTGARYIWAKPEVQVARTKLYENLSNLGIDAPTIVLSRIEKSIDKYMRAFNLIDLNDLL